MNKITNRAFGASAVYSAYCIIIRIAIAVIVAIIIEFLSVTLRFAAATAAACDFLRIDALVRTFTIPPGGLFFALLLAAFAEFAGISGIAYLFLFLDAVKVAERLGFRIRITWCPHMPVLAAIWDIIFSATVVLSIAIAGADNRMAGKLPSESSHLIFNGRAFRYP